MIRKLKRKFTVLATISMFLLMSVLILIMNIVNYSAVVSESDAVLDVLSQAGAPPDGDFPFPDWSDTRTIPFMPNGMSPEVPYESRYFTVEVGADGTVKGSNLSRIISVDSRSVSQYIGKAVASDRARAFIGQFRYVKLTDETDDVTRILFLDCGRRLDSFYTFLWISVGVGLFGCVVVFAAFMLVSGRIVRPIADSYEKQKRFISDAGHEIKTPLTIINANVDLLELDGEKEELSEIRCQTIRLTELTNNLVCLSKMEESDNGLQKIAMPLSDIISETASSFQAPAVSGSITFTKNIQPGISMTGAPDSIRQLVCILMDNAVKYTPDGGTITVGLTVGKRTAVFTVFNNTVNRINEQDIPRMFDRFYRADASRSSRTGGHGIGLSIAKAIVESHGGRIGAETRSGFDFCVTAELPLSGG